MPALTAHRSTWCRPYLQSGAGAGAGGEWHAGDALSFLHDTYVGNDGKLYGIDEGKDMIFVLDRVSGGIEEVHIPASDLPVGGRFQGSDHPSAYSPDSTVPSAAQLPDGRMYITASLSGELLMFNPATGVEELPAAPGGSSGARVSTPTPSAQTEKAISGSPSMSRTA